jgi:hypothetical protein
MLDSPELARGPLALIRFLAKECSMDVTGYKLRVICSSRAIAYLSLRFVVFSQFGWNE